VANLNFHTYLEIVFVDRHNFSQDLALRHVTSVVMLLRSIFLLSETNVSSPLRTTEVGLS
jgi:hypothetical protein